MKERLTEYIINKFGADKLCEVLQENRLQLLYSNGPHNVKLLLNKANVLLLEKELLAVCQLFDGYKIEHIAFKGVVLSNKLYENRYIRIFNDIDIFVPPEDFENALDILCDNGYSHRCQDALQNLHHVVLQKGKTVLELHRRILSPFTKIDETYIRKHLEEIALSGHTIKTFNVTATFLHLIYHLYMDTWLTPTDFFSLLTTKNIVKANRFLCRAYEIALFSEKYFDEIAWTEVINDIKKQPFRIMFKGMIDDILEIFPEAFPEPFINVVHSLHYDDTEKFVFFNHLVETNVLPEQIDGALSQVIDTNWSENANEKIEIHDSGDFVLKNAIVRDAVTNGNHQLVCRVHVEKMCNDVKLEFKISNDDFCFSNSGEYDTQSSDGVHLMICGTEKYSYNSIFLFPKLVNGKTTVLPKIIRRSCFTSA